MRLLSLKFCALALVSAAPVWATKTGAAKMARQPSSAAALGREALAVLVKAGQNSNSDARAASAATWGDIGNPAAVPLLKKMLKDRDGAVRLAAAKSLFVLGDKDAFNLILETAKSQPKASDKSTPIEQLKLVAKERLRIEAIKDLCAIGKPAPKWGEKAVEIFQTTINDPYGPVRDATAQALAAMGLDEFTPRFLDAAKSQDSAMRAEAIEALGQIATPDSVAAVSAAAADSSADVRSAVMEAVANFPSANASAILDKGLKDSDADVRTKALESLSKLDSEQNVAELRQAFESAPDLSTQMIAMAGLLRRGQDADESLALAALKNQDEDIRRLGIDALGLGSREESLTWLKTEMETDTSMLMRIAAAQAMLKRLRVQARKSQ